MKEYRSSVRIRDKADKLFFSVYGNDEREVKRVIKKIKTGKLKVDLQRYCVFRIKPDHTVEEFGMRIQVVMSDFVNHTTGKNTAPRGKSQTTGDTKLSVTQNRTLDKE